MELQRYLGRWYELGRYENRFERGCEGVTADYALAGPGRIGVVNTCREGAPDGQLRTARGRAKLVEGSAGAKLKVSFFGPFYGDYWVLDRDAGYGWAIVGEPSGRFLWLLAREPDPQGRLRPALVERARALGYDVGSIRPTRQPPAAEPQ